ncbi:histidine kinase [Flavitalea antarctica]
MKLQHLIFSDNPRQRATRHLLFWGTYMVYFGLQSCKPLKYEEIFQPRIYTNAVLIFCCFTPVSVFIVYSFVYYLLPLIKRKKYIALSLLIPSIYLLALLINYFTSWIMLNNLKMPIPVDNNHYNRIQNSLWTTRQSMYFGTVVLGIELVKGWYQQATKNLAMLKTNAKAEMRIEKSRIHPEWLFNALNMIEASLAARSTNSPIMILNLADVLSYSLYESDEDLVLLERELLELQHLVALEKGDTTRGLSVTMTCIGDIENYQIPPMTVINRIVQHISAVRLMEKGLCTLDLQFRIKLNRLVLDLKVFRTAGLETTTIEWPLTKATSSVSD